MLRSFLPNTSTESRRSNAWIWLYANEAIRKWQKIIEYTWKKVTTKVADTVGWKYLFTVNSRFTILWNVPENKARYINHSCLPNCEPRVVGWRIFIYAIKKIKADDELVYNYGKDYFERIIKPMWCRCTKCSKNK